MGFSNAGNTVYEFLGVGTPAIVISQARHQLKTSDALKKKKLALCLGLGYFVNQEKIKLAFLKLLKSKNLRENLSKRGKKQVDGLGVNRVANMLLQEVKNL
jgi:spore coat polysaccharide biosynthesis predicted glycosyltransferase SpsG